MSDQDSKQSSTKRRKSRQTSKQNGIQAPAEQSPIHDDKEARKAPDYEKQGQPWRTEPEIDANRQKYLTERLSIKPDDELDIGKDVG